jgi:hypothetical protein
MKPGATPKRVPGKLRRLCLGIAAVLVLFSLMPAAANAEEVGDDTNPVDGSLRVTRVDLGVRNQSAEVTGVPGVQNVQPDSARLSDISYRYWLTRGRTDFGFGIGTLSLTARPLGAPPSAAPGPTLADSTILLASAPTLTVGMRYRASPRSTVFADAAGTRGLGQNGGDAYLGKVGVEWKPASLSSRWNIAYGGIGWKLSSDSRMTLRIRGGGIGLYMRSQF